MPRYSKKMGIVSKKRGRPHKLAWVRVIMDPENEGKREQWLASVGCPSELPSQGVQQDALPATTRDANGRRVRPMKVAFGESWDHASITRQTDERLSLHKESSDDEHVKLSPAWQRYVDFMSIFAESLPSERCNAVKHGTLLAARSRYWDPAPDVPAVLGTMYELRSRWESGEVWFRRKYTRQDWTIVVEENPPGMPPDEPEDLDQAGEPDGLGKV